jgi:uncharacterized protein
MIDFIKERIMERAIGSKVNLRDIEDMLAVEYMSCIWDIKDNEKIQKLDQCTHHYNTSRLQHSLNVSYYSFLICHFLGWDYRSAARAGLMHDLFYYDWRVTKSNRTSHASWHPRVAYDNAKKICDLNPIETDAILKHMWPCTLVPPKYKESFVVTMVDKVCALFEVMGKKKHRHAVETN